MSKESIIEEIKRTASENGGKPLGQERFKRVTGISPSTWRGKYWRSWAEALNEAGYKENKMTEAYTNDFLLGKLADLIKKLGHFPTLTEIRFERQGNRTFPCHTVYDKFKNKAALIKETLSYCTRNDRSSLVDVCEVALKKIRSKHESKDNDLDDDQGRIGYVYLLQHGSRSEYKIGKTMNILRREGEIRCQLPEDIKPIHTIKTDDPSGIEAYWHKRFSDKRKNGEWFQLSKKDVISFKKWKNIC